MLLLAASQLVPPSLPGPSLIDTFIFEKPELFVTTQAIASMVLLWRINQRGMLAKLWVVPVLCLLLGVAAYVVGSVVETDREKIVGRTVEMVDALAEGDASRVDAMLADQLVVVGVPLAVNKESVLAMLNRPELQGITGHSIRIRGAVKDNENSGRTQAAVSATHDSYGSTSVPGIFEFAWRRTDTGEWVVTKLTMLRQPM